MNKKLVTGLLCAAVLVVSSVAFAADVVVTKRGKKYHLATCTLIEGKKTAVMDEQQAIAKGLRPCPRCFKTKDVKQNVETMPVVDKKEEKKK